MQEITERHQTEALQEALALRKEDEAKPASQKTKAP
jgi:hypothetical protein